MGKDKRIKTVIKVVRVLEEVICNGDEASLTELSTNLSIPTSTLHRLLATLRDVNFVRQNPETGKYSIGDKLKSLALFIIQQTGLRDRAYPYLKTLMEETGETANLVILDSISNEAVYIQQVESKAIVSGLSLIGNRAPLHATGVGKVLLAGLNWSEATQILEENALEVLTENTITDMSELRKELEEVADQGFAVDREECEKGAACIAAPVMNYGGEIVAAISITGPPGRILGESFSELTLFTKNQAEKLSENLGARTQSRLTADAS